MEQDDWWKLTLCLQIPWASSSEIQITSTERIVTLTRVSRGESGLDHLRTPCRQLQLQQRSQLVKVELKLILEFVPGNSLLFIKVTRLFGGCEKPSNHNEDTYQELRHIFS